MKVSAAPQTENQASLRAPWWAWWWIKGWIFSIYIYIYRNIRGDLMEDCWCRSLGSWCTWTHLTAPLVKRQPERSMFAHRSKNAVFALLWRENVRAAEYLFAYSLSSNELKDSSCTWTLQWCEILLLTQSSFWWLFMIKWILPVFFLVWCNRCV